MNKPLTSIILIVFCVFFGIASYGADIGLIIDNFGKGERALKTIGVQFDKLDKDITKLSKYKLIIIGHNDQLGLRADLEPIGEGTKYATAFQNYVANGGFILQMFHWCEQPATWNWMPIPLEGVINNLEGPSVAVDPNHPIFTKPNKVATIYENNCWGTMDSAWGNFTPPFVDALIVGAEYNAILVKDKLPTASFIVEAKYKNGGYMLVQGLVDVACDAPANTAAQKSDARKFFENIVKYCLGPTSVEPSVKLSTCWGEIKSGQSPNR